MRKVVGMDDVQFTQAAPTNEVGSLLQLRHAHHLAQRLGDGVLDGGRAEKLSRLLQSIDVQFDGRSMGIRNIRKSMPLA